MASELDRLEKLIPTKPLDRDGRRLGRWVSGGDGFRVFIDMSDADLSLVEQASMTTAVEVAFKTLPALIAVAREGVHQHGDHCTLCALSAAIREALGDDDA